MGFIVNVVLESMLLPFNSADGLPWLIIALRQRNVLPVLDDNHVDIIQCEQSAKHYEGAAMELKKLPYELTICKVASMADIDLNGDFFFIGKTDEEISLICLADDAPAQTIEREDGWKGFRIEGVLDFSLIGILSRITGVLADSGIGIFAVSTYNTDYILVKGDSFDKAAEALAAAGYSII